MLRIDEFVHHHPFLVLLIIPFFSLYYFFRKEWVHNNPPRRLQRPPSPPRLPILGNLHQLSALSHQSLHSLGTRYGPLMLLHFGSKPVIIVQSASSAREIMKTKDLMFADKPHTSTTRRLFYGLKDVAMAPYSDNWRKLKSVFAVQLLNAKRVRSFGFIREEETAIMMTKIGSCAGSPLKLIDLFVALTNDVIFRAAFGTRFSAHKFMMLPKKILELTGAVSIGEFVPWLSWINYVSGFDNRVDEVAREVDEFLELVLEEQLMLNEQQVNDNKDESGETAFVNILLNVYKDNQTGVSIDRDTIKAIILDIFAGATDTTAATLEWVMTELLRHPIVLNKLQNEVREIMREKQGVITDNDLAKMRYLKAVVRETLRLHPPIGLLAREARENAEVMGYEIAARTMILINIWAIGRDPVSWDEPDRFLPERFETCSVDFQGLDFELIPFGAGRRGCPGTGFAMAGVELVLANLVHKFEWKLPEGVNSQDLDIVEQPGVTIHKKNPLFAVATPCCF